MRKFLERNARSAGITGERSAGSGSELVELILQLLQRCLECGEALPFLGDHRGGSTLDEAGICELGACLGYFAFEARDLPLQTGTLGGGIHLKLNHQVCSVDDRDRRVRLWKRRDLFE